MDFMPADSVFDTAVDFLENGGELPDRVTNKFLAACLRQVHVEAKFAGELSRKNKIEIDVVKRRFGWLAGGNGLGIILVLAKAFGFI